MFSKASSTLGNSFGITREVVINCDLRLITTSKYLKNFFNAGKILWQF
jgi:hypothetical protein